MIKVVTKEKLDPADFTVAQNGIVSAVRNQDTGWRKITSSTLASGYIAVRRVGNWVMLTLGGGQFDGVKFKASNDPSRTVSGGYTNITADKATLLNFNALPVGFRCAKTQTAPLWDDTTGAVWGLFKVHSTSDQSTVTAVAKGKFTTPSPLLFAGQVLYWTDDAWPSVLPPSV